ncbi:ABC-type multidrug transport system permease subunit [Catalinimonas alkaloidigena]|uniref:hypothetical protein n=1 Tax=Catalinimonas alkaloidigena TaxID=1075417 RepID=UPI002406B82C|nr:hypothetical protein [Catalinimonas alkaloidigena]MDF9798715.1 ABC-type multidrug transport system permease subunit [Catalinimonas alkaloidigena]
MEELKNLLILTVTVVSVLIIASLPWMFILAFGFRSLAAEMEQVELTFGLGNAYVSLLIIAMVSSALILFFLVSWVVKHKDRFFKP